MKVNDGTGLGTMPPSKQGLEAFQDAEPKGSGKDGGTGDDGKGPVKSAGRNAPINPGGGKDK